MLPNNVRTDGGPAGCRQTTEELLFTREGTRGGPSELVMILSGTGPSRSSWSERSGELPNLFVQAVRRWESGRSPLNVTKEQLWSGRHVIEELFESLGAQLGFECVRVNAEQFHGWGNISEREMCRIFHRYTRYVTEAEAGDWDYPMGVVEATTESGEIISVLPYKWSELVDMVDMCRKAGEVEALRHLFILNHVISFYQLTIGRSDGVNGFNGSEDWVWDRLWYIHEQEVLNLRSKLFSST